MSKDITPVRCLAPVSRLACDLLVACVNGYDADEGLSLEFIDAHTHMEAIASRKGGKVDYEKELLDGLLTGEFQLAYVNKPLFIHWLQEGVDVKFFSELGWLDREHRVMGLLVRRELWESGEVRSLADLKGRRLGGETSGLMSEVIRDELLDEGGLTVKDIEHVHVQRYEHAESALQNGDIDAVLLGEPYLSQLTLSGVGVKMEDPVIGGQMDTMLVLGNRWWGEYAFPSGAIACNREFAEERPDALQAFLRVKLRTAAYVDVHRSDFINIVSKATGHSREVLQNAGFHHYVPYVDVGINQTIADKLFQHGYSSKNTDIADHICEGTPLF